MTNSGSEVSPALELPFERYSEAYDLLYQDKDYPAESAFVSELIRRFFPAASGRERVVDLACGTGRHAIELTKRGYQVTGSDISQQMIAIAKARAATQHLEIPLHVRALQSCRQIGGEFDVALAMFSSLGYLLSRQDLEAALSGVRGLLVPGGLFVFDVWNGLAVVKDYSPVRVKRASNASVSVLRVSRTKLDELKQLAKVDFELFVAPVDGRLIEFSETHSVRFFFPRELTDALESSGFEVLVRCPFMDSSRPLAPRDWNMTFVARKHQATNAT